MDSAASDSDVAEKIASLKSDLKSSPKKAAADRKVLPKRTTRGQRWSKASESSADGSVVSSASSQDLYEPIEAHYLWGCELTRKNNCYVLPFPSGTAGDDDDDVENENHLLTIKSAALGVDAQEGDRNVVEIRYHDLEDKETSAVFASLTLGKQEFCRLDLTISHLAGRDVTLKLIKGSGPVSILGDQFVETFGSVVDEDFRPDASSAESSEASGMETEGDEVEANEVQDITDEAKKMEKEEK